MVTKRIGSSFLEKKQKTTLELIYSSNSFYQEEVNKNGSEVKRFDRNGFIVYGFNCSKQIFDNKEKIQEAFCTFPWHNYYAVANFQNSNELMKKRFELETNTYQYAFINFKSYVQLSLFF